MLILLIANSCNFPTSFVHINTSSWRTWCIISAHQTHRTKRRRRSGSLSSSRSSHGLSHGATGGVGEHYGCGGHGDGDWYQNRWYRNSWIVKSLMMFAFKSSKDCMLTRHTSFLMSSRAMYRYVYCHFQSSHVYCFNRPIPNKSVPQDDVFKPANKDIQATIGTLGTLRCM